MDLLFVYLAVSAAHFVAAASPGPSFIIVARSAVSGSREAGLVAALGMGAGALIWAGAAVFGLQTLFLAAPWLYTGMKVLGACYLLYLAVMLWRHARDPLPIAQDTPEGRRPHGGVFRRALATQLSNPKAAIFFGSVFITLIPADVPGWFYAIILPSIFLMESAWYGFVALALSARTMRASYQRLKSTIDRVSGMVLAGLGLTLLLDRS